MFYLAPCNKQRSRHLFLQAQTCRGDPGIRKKYVSYREWTLSIAGWIPPSKKRVEIRAPRFFFFNLVKIFEGSPPHWSSAWFYRNRTFTSPEVAPCKTTPHVTIGVGNLSEGRQESSMRLSMSGSRTQSQNLPKSDFSVQTEDMLANRVSSSSSRRSTTPEGRTGRIRRLSPLLLT